MTRADVTTLWARAFTDELARAGLRDVVVAPGSRSTPLVLALAADARFRIRVHLDERSAGFFALGVGKATGRPAAVVTTSGTATANLLPAVVEAAQGETPLLVLTADRPPRLRDSDANQAIDQVRLYGGYAKASFDAAPPTREGPALRHLRGLAARAVLEASEDPAGPVHVNLPFDKPLEPVGETPEGAAFAAQHPLAAGGRPHAAAWVHAVPGLRRATGTDVAFLVGLVRGAGRAVLVAGPGARPEALGRAAVRFAAAAGVPLLADPLSGARFRPPQGAWRVPAYDLFLRDPAVRESLAPDLVVRVGASPTSAALQAYLEHHNGARHVVIDGGRRWKDHGAVATDYLRADAADLLEDAAAALEAARPPGASGQDGTARADAGASDAWTGAWQRAAEAAEAALLAERGGAPHEGDVLREVAIVAPVGATMFVSGSMPVRDLDAFAAPRADTLRVLGNRGASGIDGIVSTAFGVASTGAAPTVCVLGDLALFHDQNGLLWSREPDAPVLFVLIDNDGGGIFHMLPVREHEPHFTPLFATPHGLDLRHAADLHGIPFEDAQVADLPKALGRALEAGGTRIVRVRTERAANRTRHLEIAEAVARSVRAALG